MEYLTADPSHFAANRAFVDTVLIPLHLVAPDAHPLEGQREAQNLLHTAQQAERMLRGRVLLMPLWWGVEERIVENLRLLTNTAREWGFQHILFLTNHLFHLDARREVDQMGAFLLITGPHPSPDILVQEIQKRWNGADPGA